MKLFGKKKENSNAQEHSLIRIAKEISENATEVIKEIESCLEDTEAYFENYIDRFEERGIEELEDVDEIEELQWLAMVDALEERDYVCECDWSQELEDFLYLLGKLKRVETEDLQLDSAWFNEDGDVAGWCEVLDEKWKGLGFVVAAIDIDSDSYILFPCRTAQLKVLSEWAEAIDGRIDLGKNM